MRRLLRRFLVVLETNITRLTTYLINLLRIERSGNRIQVDLPHVDQKTEMQLRKMTQQEERARQLKIEFEEADARIKALRATLNAIGRK